MALKWRDPPEVSGGVPPVSIRRVPPFFKRPEAAPHERTRSRITALPAGAPSAPTRGATTRSCSTGRPRGLRRARRRRDARRHRAPRRRRHRHALPPLPDPPAPARGRLRRRGRGDGAAGRRPRRPAALGRARHLAAPVRRATPRRSARWPRRCSPTIDRDAEVFQACRAADHRAPATCCSSAPRRPASCAPTPTSRDVGRMVGGIAGDPRRRPEQIERILDIVLDGLRYSPR